MQVEEVQKAAKAAVGYLAENNNADGMFVYRINMNPRIRVQEKYNILRHAGTVYAMAHYYQYQPDAATLAAILRAGKYLKEVCMRPLPGKAEMLAIWSDPEINRSDKPLQAKLGGTGLGLVALMSIEEIQPGFSSIQELRALGRFLVYMQKADGNFYSKYIPSTGGRSDNWQSLYYPGEAALGLLMLYEKDPSDVWLNSAVKVLQYLGLSRMYSQNIPADHWALLATEKLLSFKKSAASPVPRKLLINHATQICTSILQSQIACDDLSEHRGGFSIHGHVTPTATRLEGLLASHSIIPQENELRKQIEKAIPCGIAFLIRAQVGDGIYQGAFPRTIPGENQDIGRKEKNLRRATEVRIDYVQHALSAITRYLVLKKENKL